MPDSPDQADDALSPGWDAISAVLDRLYPDQEPTHWGTVIKFSLGGPDPLDGISVYLHNDGPDISHWHYVSFGLSELYQKTSEASEVSGWGFEFTFRLKRQPDESGPPVWPANLMQNLARYVFKTGNVFASGHYLPLNGPIALGQETAIHAVMFIADPELSKLEGPNGCVHFLQLVGVTMPELAATRAWNSENVIGLLRAQHPLLVTDLARPSMTNDSTVARAIEEGIARDGSSTGSLAVRELEAIENKGFFGAKSLTLVVGASGVADLQALFRGRIPFGREFHLAGPRENLVFFPADRFGWERKETANLLEIRLPADAARELAATLQPRRGDYAVPKLAKLTVRVVPTKIMDSTGKTVVEVIG